MVSNSIEKTIELKITYSPSTNESRVQLEQTLKDSLATFKNHLESELMYVSYTEK